MFAQSLLYLIVLKNLLIYTQVLISSGNETWLDAVLSDLLGC